MRFAPFLLVALAAALLVAVAVAGPGRDGKQAAKAYWRSELLVWAQEKQLGRLGAALRAERRDNRLLRGRLARAEKQHEAIRRLQAHRSTEATIMLVFAGHGSEAVRVASCETGGTLATTASNGQFRGLFQMGSSERRTYGHGPTVLEQALAAYRYFVASGQDWSPWECKP